MSHKSPTIKYLDNAAESYDLFNEKNPQTATRNKILEKILKKNKVKTVLDLTCGTGSQLFYLYKKGYTVVGSDISKKMLAIAKSKNNAELKFIHGDMRNKKVGKFDAVITIFNSIGYLTKKDFEKTIQNVADNLKPNGLYIFDINNFNYLNTGENIINLTIDWFKKLGKENRRYIQHSTIDKNGILASFTTTYINGKGVKSKQTLQTYSADQLNKILKRNGFKTIEVLNIDGSKFHNTKSDTILMTASKI